jgi:hypothetical protein
MSRRLKPSHRFNNFPEDMLAVFAEMTRVAFDSKQFWDLHGRLFDLNMAHGGNDAVSGWPIPDVKPDEWPIVCPPGTADPDADTVPSRRWRELEAMLEERRADPVRYS